MALYIFLFVGWFLLGMYNLRKTQVQVHKVDYFFLWVCYLFSTFGHILNGVRK